MGRFSIAKKKERWVATRFGNILKILTFLILIIIFVITIHPFLAQTKTIETKVMVVEGFIPDFALEATIAIFYDEQYDLMIITGKKKLKGSYLDKYKNDGQHAAATLAKMEFDTTKIKIISVGDDIRKDRTYATAVAVEQWLEKSNMALSLNLVTLGCHGRRSRLLFDKAMGKGADVGIISINDIRYNPDRWWKSSMGFRSVINESVAYIYARFFFYP